MHCPICNGVDVGKVGSNRFYCWNCFLEFSVNAQQEITYYYVQEDGSLMRLSDPEERFALEK